MQSYSFIIPTKNISNLLINCIQNYVNLINLNKFKYEIIIVVDEIQNDQIIIDFKKKFNELNILILESGRNGPSHKRNIAAMKAKYEYLIFIDDDAYPYDDYLVILNKHIISYKFPIYVGPSITPSDDTFFSKMTSLFFENKLLGGFPERYRPIKDLNFKEVSDWPTVNFVIKKKLFIDLSGFDVNIWPGEDSEFCDRLLKNNSKIIYFDNLIVNHYRRSTIYKFLKQLFFYGYQRSYLFRNNSINSQKLIYFIPSIFLIFFIYAAFFSNYFYLFISLYTFLILILSLGKEQKKFHLIFIPIVSLCAHLSYGLGFIISFLFRRSISKS